MVKLAIITGISGQDGSYLAELLLDKGYKIIGICNPKKKYNFKNFYKIKKKIDLKKIDINNYSKINSLIKKTKPQEFYHLAAQSFINYKFEDEFFKLNPNINGTHYILSAIKEFSPKQSFILQLHLNYLVILKSIHKMKILNLTQISIWCIKNCWVLFNEKL